MVAGVINRPCTNPCTMINRCFFSPPKSHADFARDRIEGMFRHRAQHMDSLRLLLEPVLRTYIKSSSSRATHHLYVLVVSYKNDRLEKTKPPFKWTIGKTCYDARREGWPAAVYTHQSQKKELKTTYAVTFRGRKGNVPSGGWIPCLRAPDAWPGDRCRVLVHGSRLVEFSYAWTMGLGCESARC
jgi:hypothetical protein